MIGVVRAWKCANGHAIGGIAYDYRGFSVLYPFRSAVVLNGHAGWSADEFGELPVLGGPVQGTFRGLRCSICGAERDWHEDVKRKSRIGG